MSSVFLAAVMYGLVAFAGSALLTGWARILASAAGLIDRPNPRSSHVRATPRGGGLAIVITVSALLAYLRFNQQLSPELFLALVVGGLAVTTIGLLDDWRSLSPAVRFLVHVAAATWAVYWLQGAATVPAVFSGRGVLLVIAVVWMTNLFNFMDGIDGLATMEAASVALGAASLSLLSGHADILRSTWILAGACIGFLCWNWPPARIFLGDVGSGYLGYLIAVLAIADARGHWLTLVPWLILCGAFVVDATLTLLLRLLRRSRIFQAHRQHAYQWLARRWHSHRAVTLLVLGINVVWLFPLALLAARLPDWCLAVFLVAVLPLVLGALLAGAGRPEASKAVVSDASDAR
jgi:Fuc2NAc and GlcNAc transferase